MEALHLPAPVKVAAIITVVAVDDVTAIIAAAAVDDVTAIVTVFTVDDVTAIVTVFTVDDVTAIRWLPGVTGGLIVKEGPCIILKLCQPAQVVVLI